MLRNRKPPKIDRHEPETPGQAQAWERVRGRYERAGLCARCAAQAAWGHQCGFATIAPPCPACASVVAQLPTPAVAPWRKLLRGADFDAPGGSGGVTGPGKAHSHPDGARETQDGPPESGRWGRATCSGCSASWTGLAAAHCAACHRTFAGASLFDRHRAAGHGSHGTCLDPGELRGRDGYRLMLERDGVWHGPPMPAHVLAAHAQGRAGTELDR